MEEIFIILDICENEWYDAKWNREKGNVVAREEEDDDIAWQASRKTGSWAQRAWNCPCSGVYVPRTYFCRGFRARVSACTRNINIPFSCRSIFALDVHNDGKSRNLQYAFPGETMFYTDFASLPPPPHLYYILVYPRFQHHYSQLISPQSY